MIMLFSALMHEIGHLSALTLLGYRFRRIDVLPMGALIVVPEGIPYESEFVIAVSGPIVSLIVSIGFAIAYFINGTPLLLFGVISNLVFALFNLLPERKLDGGKALFCFLIKRKNAQTVDRICESVSMLSKAFFLIFVLFCASMSGFNLGVTLLSFSLLLQLVCE